jgi:hypothetical protein
MILNARRAVTIAACAAALLLAVSGSRAQPGGAEPCRQGLLALIVMIEAEEHNRPYYQSKAKDVVQTCGRPAAEKTANAAPAATFDAKLCGGLAFAMLGDSEGGKLDGAPFVKARDEFAARCMGAEPRP